MRLVLACLALAACSGLPPETLTPLQGGEGVAGATVAVDLGQILSPEVSVWFGFGLGRGVDVAVGVDAPIALLMGAPGSVTLPLRGYPPGLMLRKSFDGGWGVGVGSGTRLLFPPDSAVGLAHLATAGAFVTVASPPDETALGRATLHVGYAEVRRPNAGPTLRGLAVHVGGQGGVGIAMADTARAVVAARATAGAFVWPRRSVVLGPTVGVTGQIVDFGE